MSNIETPVLEFIEDGLPEMVRHGAGRTSTIVQPMVEAARGAKAGHWARAWHGDPDEDGTKLNGRAVQLREALASAGLDSHRVKTRTVDTESGERRFEVWVGKLTAADLRSEAEAKAAAAARREAKAKASK